MDVVSMRDFEEGASPATSGSATDVSEDSVEVRVVPVRRPSGNTLPTMTSSSSTTSSPAALSVRRHKRKSAEPRKLKDITTTTCTPQVPKRCKWEQVQDEVQYPSRTITEDPTANRLSSSIVAPDPAASTAFFDVTEEEEDDDDDEEEDEGFRELARGIASSDPRCRMPFYDALAWATTPRARSSCSNVAMVPLRTSSAASTSRTDSEEVASTSAEVEGDVDVDDDGDDLFQKPKSYKNMTRERRMEANARERTRVHTISAAFESLRRAVPSYSCHQKLSKLAILRIACSYILALASLNDMDYSQEQDNPSFGECVDLCTRTIQAEGRTRKRKE